jgi:hypothetical protein
MKASVVILIISHKESLTDTELLSLKQCYKILGSYPIKIIAPEGNSVEFYNQHLPNPEFEFVEPDKLSDYQKFNNFKISLELYKKFSNYEYILFYEPDAYVFRDELSYWCRTGYDYIGAPWFGNFRFEDAPLRGVGNGGFSLRNTRSALSLLNKLRFLEILEVYQKFNSKGIITRLPVIFAKLIESKRISSLFEKTFPQNEDVFWGVAAPQRITNFHCHSMLLKFIASLILRNNFKVAPISTAISFSFETDPRLLYEINNEQLPFGCHAWEKYDFDFWRPFILL